MKLKSPFSTSSKELTACLPVGRWAAALVLAVAGLFGSGESIVTARAAASEAGIDSQFSWSKFAPPKRPAVTRETLALGKDVYTRYCLSCHGANGAGDGWRAAYLYPKPRNFTRGIFRFKTTESGNLPYDRDLYRTISVGVLGTAMPAWGYILPEDARWAAVAHLKRLTRAFAQEPAGTPVDVGSQPAITSARIARGQKLFAEVGCVECHGPEGYGNGRAAENMEDSFGFPIQPRNFHRAWEFKRGRTHQDVALTITTGNDGTPMPSFQQALTKDQIWSLAAFVMSLPVEPAPRMGCPMMSGTMRAQ